MDALARLEPVARPLLDEVDQPSPRSARRPSTRSGRCCARSARPRPTRWPSSPRCSRRRSGRRPTPARPRPGRTTAGACRRDLAWPGAAADAYQPGRRARRPPRGAERRGSLVARLRPPRRILQAIGRLVRSGRGRVAHALAEVLGSAQAVTLRAGPRWAGAGRPRPGAGGLRPRSVLAAADIGAACSSRRAGAGRTGRRLRWPEHWRSSSGAAATAPRPARGVGDDRRYRRATDRTRVGHRARLGWARWAALRGQLQPVRPAVLPRPGRAPAGRRRPGAGAHRRRPRGRRVRLGRRVDRRGHVGLPAAARPGRRRRPAPRRADPAGQGRGEGRGQAAHPRARAADEGGRDRPRAASAAAGGGARTTIYFTAPHRVDFRSLVRDLGATLRCRVELRQLSARDSARVQGGIGSCGRDLCCATFLTDFEPVTIRMAKDQDLPLNPMRISGRLRPADVLPEVRAPAVPAVPGHRAGRRASGSTTPEGDGRVVGHSVPRDAVVVRMDADGSRCSCSRASVCGSARQGATTTASG